MIGIVLMGALELAPYAKNYINMLEKHNIPYEVVHWKRENEIEYDGENIHTHQGEFKRFASVPEKIKTYLGFRKFMLKIIKAKKYDRLIVLTTQTAILMPHLLCRKYKGKYFFDYRDASYEYKPLYKKVLWKIIDCSRYTVISSPGFKEYLPQKEYLLAHNFLKERIPEEPVLFKKKTLGEKLVIGYIGVLREIEYHKKDIAKLAENKLFEIYIYGGGEGLQDLKEFASQYENVKVFGTYQEKDKYDIVTTFDMMLYTYPNSFMNYPALANKYYDSIILKKPMIVNDETFSGKLVLKDKIGVAFNNKTDDASKVYDYYYSINEDEYNEKCKDILNSVLEDDRKYKKEIESFVISKENV